MIAVTPELPVDVVSKKFREGITVTEKNENTVQLVFGLGFHSSTIENDDHDALLLLCCSRFTSLERTRRTVR